ncbi:unnamed protein product [Schistocephalus solidus]|uniref:Uncharacterized protein n=1 Tax=Schistocephalus solidus TaxID=70667 RepID=A0A183SF03_SCHSO|nr:unnamed protein product [Schistocephalus solidus]
MRSLERQDTDGDNGCVRLRLQPTPRPVTSARPKQPASTSTHPKQAYTTKKGGLTLPASVGCTVWRRCRHLNYTNPSAADR